MSEITLSNIIAQMPSISEEELNEALHALIDKGLLCFKFSFDGHLKFSLTEKGAAVYKLLNDRTLN